MRKLKLMTIAIVVASSATGLAASPTWAVPAEWMLNGKTLLEEGLTTAALTPTATTDEPLLLSSAGLTVACEGSVKAEVPEIAMPNIIKDGSLIVTGCAVTTPETCSVSTTIGTVPVESEWTLEGALATKAIIHPKAGKVLTTIVITGAECNAAGNKPVTGDFEVLAPEGRDERAGQLIKATQGSTGLLKTGSESISISGSALVLLANNATWSFL